MIVQTWEHAIKKLEFVNVWRDVMEQIVQSFATPIAQMRDNVLETVPLWMVLLASFHLNIKVKHTLNALKRIGVQQQ